MKSMFSWLGQPINQLTKLSIYHHIFTFPDSRASQSFGEKPTYASSLSQKIISSPIFAGLTPSLRRFCFCCLFVPVVCALLSLTTLKKRGKAYFGRPALTCFAKLLSTSSLGVPLSPTSAEGFSTTAAQPARPS